MAYSLRHWDGPTIEKKKIIKIKGDSCSATGLGLSVKKCVGILSLSFDLSFFLFASLFSQKLKSTTKRALLNIEFKYRNVRCANYEQR